MKIRNGWKKALRKYPPEERAAWFSKITSGTPVSVVARPYHLQRNALGELMISQEAIAATRTMGARCFQSGSWRRSGRRSGWSLEHVPVARPRTQGAQRDGHLVAPPRRVRQALSEDCIPASPTGLDRGVYMIRAVWWEPTNRAALAKSTSI